MKLFLLIVLLSASMLQAQVSIIIEAETEEGFLLGINGYLQNEEATQALVITRLDTSVYQFNVKTGAKEFGKKVQLRESGNHKYVLTKDFNGHFKLRYRGLQSKLPASATSISYHEDSEWISSIAATSIVATEVIKEHNLEEMAPKEVLADPEIPASKPDTLVERATTTDSSSSSNAVALLFTSSDTLQGESEKKDSSDTLTINPGSEANFQLVLEKLAQTEFEFDKLSICKEYISGNKIDSDQLGTLFSQLRYDQSRMQLARHSIQQVTDPENLSAQSIHFDYEVTKSKYILFLNE